MAWLAYSCDGFGSGAETSERVQISGMSSETTNEREAMSERQTLSVCSMASQVGTQAGFASVAAVEEIGQTGGASGDGEKTPR